MIVIEKTQDFTHLENGNVLIGEPPEMEDSRIEFFGNNNVLFCDKGEKIRYSTLSFHGDNSVIYLSKSLLGYSHVEIHVYQNCVCAFGERAAMLPSRSNSLEIFATENRNVFFGNNCFLARGCLIRSSDAHPIFSVSTGKRIARAKSVFIGDHVWLAQGVVITKGTQIDSGSIIGSMACVPGKKIPHNTSWGGNPARQIGSDVFWNPSSDHAWTDMDCPFYEDYTTFIDSPLDISKQFYPEEFCRKDSYIYEYDPKQVIEYDDIDRNLHNAEDAMERYTILRELYANSAKNRFVHC